MKVPIVAADDPSFFNWTLTFLVVFGEYEAVTDLGPDNDNDFSILKIFNYSEEI